MTDADNLMQLAAALKALHAERKLLTAETPHRNVIQSRAATRQVLGDLKTLAERMAAEILLPICKGE